MTGLAVAKRLTEEGSATKLIVLSPHEERAYFKRAMEAGVRGYVLVRWASDNLLFATRSVAKGGFHIDPILAGQIAGLSSRGLDRSNDGGPRLSAREEEVQADCARFHHQGGRGSTWGDRASRLRLRSRPERSCGIA